MPASSLPLESVIVGERHRALSEDAVATLMASMTDIGLRQPVTIIWLRGPDTDVPAPMLVAGRHRLEAARRLGWTHIDCIEFKGDPIRAEMWELAENLHRLDLSKQERDGHIRRYAELIAFQSRQNVANESRRADGKGHRQEGAASKIAKAAGLSKRTVERALKPPTPAAQPAAPAPKLNGHPAGTLKPRSAAAYEALKRAWERADKAARARFLSEVAPAAQMSLFDQGCPDGTA